MILEDLKHAEFSEATAATFTVAAAPGAGKYLAIDFVTLNPDGGANTLTLVSGSTTLATFVLNDNQPLTFENAIQHQKGVLTCADNEAFKITLSAATSVTGFIRYRIVE